jgi:hypothetical protein
MQLTIPYKEHEIVVTAESPDIPRYDAGSADNVCAPGQEHFIDDEGYRPSSRHRVCIRRGNDVLASRAFLHAEAVDFDGVKYRFELETGQSRIITT